MKRLLFALALTAAAFVLPQSSTAQISTCPHDCRIVCSEPDASPYDHCVNRCGVWSRTTCGAWNPTQPCSPC